MGYFYGLGTVGRSAMKFHLNLRVWPAPHPWRRLRSISEFPKKNQRVPQLSISESVFISCGRLMRFIAGRKKAGIQVQGEFNAGADLTSLDRRSRRGQGAHCGLAASTRRNEYGLQCFIDPLNIIWANSEVERSKPCLKQHLY